MNFKKFTKISKFSRNVQKIMSKNLEKNKKVPKISKNSTVTDDQKLWKKTPKFSSF